MNLERVFAGVIVSLLVGIVGGVMVAFINHDETKVVYTNTMEYNVINAGVSLCAEIQSKVAHISTTEPYFVVERQRWELRGEAICFNDFEVKFTARVGSPGGDYEEAN